MGLRSSRSRPSYQPAFPLADGTSRRRPARAQALRHAAAVVIDRLESRTLFATYSVVDLGTLGGPGSDGHAINASGQVALESDIPPSSNPDATIHGARATGSGTPTDIGTLGGPT